MEAIITSVTYLTFSISDCVKLDKNFALWSDSLLGIILSSSPKCNTPILHIKGMYANT